MAWLTALMGRIPSNLTSEMMLIMCRLNVARLANVPGSILQLAAVKSKELEEVARENGIQNLYVQLYISGVDNIHLTQVLLPPISSRSSKHRSD